ncbi:IS1 family transposase [Phenylobacterium sp.]|uniref:IS1 family transposase n=1 Tax=Phenylobacterium sp. TaxID=1871053 RepID=UPI0025D96E78|nr:IS1 family transposase [Phenylobacterium sp.]
MNKLSQAQRAQILHLLCEGMSIRAITRITGASKNTVAKLLNDAGAALGAYQDRVFRNLTCKSVQVDEIWSFTYAKARNVESAKAATEGAGDTWTWTAIDADTKLVFSVLVGGRDAGYAYEFLSDVRSRVTGRFQLTSDGLRSYANAAFRVFDNDVDYGQLVKTYGPAPEGQRRYSPPKLLSATPSVVIGDPDVTQINTSFVERQNLTMRMHMRRFTRLTNGFSKKVEAHVNAIALHFAYYNFVRIHKTLRMTPAMAAGVTDRLWEMADLVSIVEAQDAKPVRPATYRKKVKAA